MVVTYYKDQPRAAVESHLPTYGTTIRPSSRLPLIAIIHTSQYIESKSERVRGMVYTVCKEGAVVLTFREFDGQPHFY